MALTPAEAEALNDRVQTLRDVESDADEALAERLARLIYALNGYHVPEGYKFSTATHPQESAMFDTAVLAINFIREEGLPT